MLSQLSIVAMLFTAGNSFRTGTDLEKEQECGESNSSPEYFTSLREKYGVEECGKKDVCLLMRQLDAYFYSRALKGELVDYGAPPAGKWLRSGHCTRSLRSQKLAPVTSKEECKKILAEETKKKLAMSTEKIWLFRYIRTVTKECNKPLSGSILTNQYTGKLAVFFGGGFP